MDCEQALTLLVADMDREMLPDDRARLLAHLNDCAACGAAADALRLQDADLRRGFAGRRRAAAAVAERVIGQIRMVPASRERAWFPWVLALTSAAAGFLLAVVLFQPWSRTTQVVKESHENRIPVVRDSQTSDGAVQLALCSPLNAAIEVQLPSSSTWQAMNVGQAVAPGSHVRTGSNLRCELRTPDGSLVRLNSKTEVIVAAPRQFNLVLGQMMARVAPAQQTFEVRLADATVTALATEFDILCGPAETILSVLEGETRLDIRDNSQLIKEGLEARIRNGRMEQLKKLNVHSDDWTRDFLLLKGRNDPELHSRVMRQLNDILAQLGAAKMEWADESEIRSLGDRCVMPLTRYIESERSRAPQDRRKRHTAAHILCDLAQPWSVGDLVELLTDSDGVVRAYAARALKRLTNMTFGEPDDWRDKSPDELKPQLVEWQTWWQKNKHRYPLMPQ
jgi:ferric-dicitrate binding protein FerR (iron transport regulator)